MSIGHFASVISATQRRDDQFAPTIDGRVDADGIVEYSFESDFEISPLDAYADDRAVIWLIKTSTDCFVRVGRWQGGDPFDEWYNGVGTAQGDPGLYTGTGTTVFTLNEVPDTVNIYNKQDTTTTGSPVFTAYGTSYTSDDKTTFFNPTQDAKYGRYVDCSSAITGLGTDTHEGETTLQFTFRSSGKDDYTVTFRVRCKTTATVEI